MTINDAAFEAGYYGDATHQWTTNELRTLAQQITYKPGYIVDLKQHRNFPGIELSIRCNTWDSTKPDALYHLHFEQVIPCHLGLSLDYLLETIRRAFHTFETHEADEWFRVAGKQFANPHASDRR